MHRLESAFSVPFSEDTPGTHWFGKSFHRGQSELREFEQIAHEAPRPICNDHRAGFSEALQPRCQIRRLSCDAALLRFARANEIADNDQPGGDPNARMERFVLGCAELSDASNQRQAG